MFKLTLYQCRNRLSCGLATTLKHQHGDTYKMCGKDVMVKECNGDNVYFKNFAGATGWGVA